MLYNERERLNIPGPDEKLIEVTERIKTSPRQRYDFKSIAAGLNISYSHFRASFKKYTGMPPHEFLLHSRMRMAAEILCRRKIPILVFLTSVLSAAAKTAQLLPPSSEGPPEEKRGGESKNIYKCLKINNITSNKVKFF